MIVRYSPRAHSDLARILDYIDKRSPRGARNVKLAIRRAIEMTGENPYTGTKTTQPGVYKLWLAPYPYRAFYRVDGDEVVILHIRHTSRRPV